MNIKFVQSISTCDEEQVCTTNCCRVFYEGSHERTYKCATETMSVDELVTLRDYLDKKIKQRVFTKHSQATICSEF